MFQRLWALAILLVVGSLSMPALAADPTASSVPFVNGGTIYNEWTFNDGTRFYVGHLNFGWTGTAPKAWTMDTSGNGGVNVENWPSFWPYTLNGDGGVPSHMTNGPTGYALEAGHAATIDISTAAVAAAAGTKADPKSVATDTTPASEISLMKGQIDRLQAIVTALANTLAVTGTFWQVTQPVSNSQEHADLTALYAATKIVSSAPVMNVGSAYAPGLGVFLNCTAAGNVQFDFADGTFLVVPVAVGFSQVGYAATKIDAATTATCAFKQAD